MPGLKMCPVCRDSKRKCTPADRIWIPGGRQDKCERCIQLKHDCGPHEYPPTRPRASRTSDAKSQSFSSTSQLPVEASPFSGSRGMEASNDIEEVKQELLRRLRDLDMQVEATKKLQLALNYSDQSGRQETSAALLSSTSAIVRTLTLKPAQAECLADRLAGCGEIEAAEAAYIRILNVYRAFRALDIKPWHETKSLLKKLADVLWEIGEPVRAENVIWEALNLRDIPSEARQSDLDLMKSLARSDLELLKSLARSLPKTCIDISESIQSIFDGVIPTDHRSPLPPLQYMMQSSFASAVSGSPFHRGEFLQSTITPDGPIFGGIEAVMELLRVLPRDALEARDIHGQTPFYMASSLGMEGLGRAILFRLAEVPGPTNQDPLNTRDLTGQTVLGASITGGCSLHYIGFLIEGGAQVDPHPLMPMPFTPLQAAAASGSLDIVCLLLDNGAEINRVFPGNDTPLMMAQKAGHADVVGRLDIPATRYSGPDPGLGWNPD